MKITTDDIVSALRNAAFYEAREAELHYRAMLRADLKRRRRAKGRPRAIVRAAPPVAKPSNSGRSRRR